VPPIGKHEAWGPAARGPMPVPEGAEIVRSLAARDHGGIGMVIKAPALLFGGMLGAADEAELPLRLDARLRDRLDWEATHFISDPVLLALPDGTQFWRTKTWLQLKDMTPGVPWKEWLDWPARQMGTIIDAHEEQRRESPQQARSEKALRKPTWVGSHSFSHVWDQAMRGYLDSTYAGRGAEVSARSLLDRGYVLALTDAHVVCIPPEQVAVLPEWEEWQHVWDYTEDAVLPFDPVYLDFEEAGGVAPLLRHPGVTDARIALRGALLFQASGDSLCVVPVAWPEGHEAEGAWSPYMFSALVSFGNEMGLDEDVAVTEMSNGLDGQTAKGIALRLAPLTSVKPDGITDDEPGDFVGCIQMPLDPDSVEGRGHGSGEVQKWGWGILTMASRALAALSILEAEEVEIVDAPVEKRQVKRAAKRGWPIAKVVHVRESKRYRERGEPSGEEAHYSHRFWVRANTAHYPVGTQTADARPDLCKVCTRCGVCRRVKRPACIKGPKDKPIVPKSLVVDRRKNKKVA
jgi:hypothetical protein